MIYTLMNILRETMGVKVPSVFFYYSTRMMLASVTALLISIFFGPRFIKKLYELKIGQTVRADEAPLLGELHKDKRNTPTMGGMLIMFSMLCAMFLWMDLTHVFTLILFVTTVVLGLLGAFDDYLKLKLKTTKGLPGRYKLLVQAGLSFLIALYLLSPTVNHAIQLGGWFTSPVIKEQISLKVKLDPFLHEGTREESKKVQMTISVKEYASRFYMPFFKKPLFKFTGIFTLLAILFIMLVITGASNAVNLTDGLDGLAAGCLIMVATSLGFIAFISNNLDIAGYLNILYIEGSGEIAIYLAGFVGACLGFLWYNGYPAQVFMGDTGSLALGGIIGVSAVLLRRELLLAIVGGIFVAEALSVIVQVLSYRYRNKKRVFLCAPLHHHFEYKGWPETKVVLRFWIIGLLLAIVGIASLKFQ